MQRWASLNLTAEAEYWIRANNAEKLYMLGSQPPLTLALYGAPGGACQSLPAEWHLDCLGCMGAGHVKSDEQLRSAKLLHWNGPNKPFATKPKKKRAHAQLFTPYEGHGDACDPEAEPDPEAAPRPAGNEGRVEDRAERESKPRERAARKAKSKRPKY